MIRAFLGLLAALTCAGISSVLLRKGSMSVGEITHWSPLELLRHGARAATNMYVLLGIAFGIGHMSLWLVVLSWADVSWALPMNALEYLIVAAIAAVWLKEKVSPKRWAGIALISLGALLMMGSW